MSHDLKSPLTTIRAYTEALLECVALDEAARQRYLQTIYARETDLEALVNRLFELAKLGASEYPVHPEPLPLRQTVDAILADCDREGLTLDSTAVGDSTVTADRELLGRILHNLIDNSCKYGATALTLRSTQTTAGVTLQVQDNGLGVPPEQLANLFEPFYRGDAARTNPAAGSGLGLSVVRRSMQQMGGSARAEKDIPILMVTARGEDVDKIRGLGFGADDYIEKPFSPSVLVARVKAHLAQYARLKPKTAGPQRITAGPLTVDPAARTIAKNGVELPLKNKEYELRLFLMRHPEQVFSREDLYEMIWGLESMGGQHDRSRTHQPPAGEDRGHPPRTRSCCKRCGAWATGCIQFKNRLNAQGPLLKKFRYTGYSSRILLGRVPDDSNSISWLLHGTGRQYPRRVRRHHRLYFGLLRALFGRTAQRGVGQPRRAQRRLHLFAETGCWLGHRHGQLRGAAIQPV